MPTKAAQPELVVYPPERIDASGEVVVGAAPPRSWLLEQSGKLTARQRSRCAVAMAVLLLVPVAVLVRIQATDRHVQGSLPAPATVLDDPVRAGFQARGRPVLIGVGDPVDIALQNGPISLLVDNPPRLLLIDPAQPGALAAVSVPRGPRRVVYDNFFRQLWVISSDGGRSTVAQHDPITLRTLNLVRVPFQVTAAVTLRGQLWVGGTGGLYRLPAGAGAVTAIPGVVGYVGALAADPTRDRVLVTTLSGPTVLTALNSDTGTVLTRVTIPLVNASLAVTIHDIWIGGYSAAGERKMMHLDERSLVPIGTSPLDTGVGSGALIWPGDSVIWVRGDGTGDLACVNAASGEVLARWSNIAGPVVSRYGQAFAVSGGSAVMLELGRTSCLDG